MTRAERREAEIAAIADAFIAELEAGFEAGYAAERLTPAYQDAEALDAGRITEREYYARRARRVAETGRP